MRSVDLVRRVLVAGLLLALGACGGGNSTETTIIGGDGNGGSGPVVSVDGPTGDNTLEIVVDSGPASGFVLGVANLPYVTVTVCAPGSPTACTTIDHVFLDTGSIGLRVLRSKVATLGFQRETVDATTSLVECYPFVVGAVWGPVARADITLGAQKAVDVPVQVIDDVDAAVAAPPADCAAAGEGQMLQSATALQANGILGVGMLRYDCGLACQQGDYGGGYALYWACAADGVTCRPSAAAPSQQVQNPVALLPVDNNGTIVVLPAVPTLGASVAKGRLVLGIGTQTNNQIASAAQIYAVENDPASPTYLYVGTTVDGKRYPNSYIDSGSNGLFFDDATISTACAGGSGGWFCPRTEATRSAVVDDPFGAQGTVPFSILSADALFATSNVAFANLGGSAGGAANSGAFVWGLPFFYGRAVYTSIWGQALAANGPWYAF